MSTANQLLVLARKHLGEEYRYGAVAPKRNPNWRGPWDCAEFTSWCVFQVTGELFGCRPQNGNPDEADAYTGHWGVDARKKHCIISVGQAAATPGAFLLRLPGSADGHVAISAGDGTTVEAHTSRTGVVEHQVNGRRWDFGVLVPGIQVRTPDGPLPVEPPSMVLRVKSPPMHGDLVRSVQRALPAFGLDPGPLDGIFGRQTAAAVRAFQMKAGLVVDGEVGAGTASKLGISWR